MQQPKHLELIHVAHACSIPFENLEMHENDKRVNLDWINHNLDIQRIFQKIVMGNRGGHCLETNELLAFVLAELGFKVGRMMGRGLAIPGLVRGHKMLVVEIDNALWIADVGFGGRGLVKPLPLIMNQEQNDFDGKFKIRRDDSGYVPKYCISYYAHGEYKDLLEFDLVICQALDYKHFNYSIVIIQKKHFSAKTEYV